MTSTFFEEIVRYTGFEGSDKDALLLLHPHAQPHFARIADHFYAKIMEHDEAVAVFRDLAQVERLKLSMQDWLDTLLSGPWDDVYFEKRSRIGRVHVKVQLPQRYMFTAMSVIHDQLDEIVEQVWPNENDTRASVHRALSRVVSLELAIMLETYREDTLEQVRRYEQLERVRLQRKLEISEARYAAVVENAEVIVVALDEKRDTVLFNRKAEQVTDYDRAELLGTNCLELLSPVQGGQRLENAVAGVLGGEKASPFTSEIASRDGTPRWIRWHVTSLPGGDTTLACAIGVDVTEERALQLRTRRAEHLASLGTLAAGLAHEIRNPLNSAELQLMLADRRLRRSADAESVNGALSAVETVRDELKRLARLVQDFLAFAHPQKLRFTAGDICQSVHSVVDLVQPEFDEANVALSVETETPTFARYDEERIKQVLLNALRNANAAAGAGGTVEVRCCRRDDNAILQVLDSGPGVPDGIDVFEPFSTTKKAGTGLGLSIVYRIVTDHGGDIRIYRHDDKTVFETTLPVDGLASP